MVTEFKKVKAVMCVGKVIWVERNTGEVSRVMTISNVGVVIKPH